MAGADRIIGVDSAQPPASVAVQLERSAYAALLLVVPGHSATLLYPSDSATRNRLESGVSQLGFTVPDNLVRSDSALLVRRRTQRQIEDSIRLARARGRPTRRAPEPPPMPAEASTFFLLLTSPQPLDYERMIAKTAGVSIPVVESEALHAVAKAIRSTLAEEPREVAAYFVQVELGRKR